MKSAAKSSAGKRGRPDVDLAIRLRNCGWVWLVKAEADLSFEALDKHFISRSGPGRRKAFLQMYQRGSSPKGQVGNRDRRDIYEKVHAGGRFSEARAWFESPFWALISQRRFEETDYVSLLLEPALHEKVRTTRGRLKSRIDVELERLLDDKPKALERTRFKGRVEILAAGARLNEIGALCCLFREAHREFQLEQALLIAQRSLEAAHRFCTRISLEEWMSSLLLALVYRRVVRNNWVSLDAVNHERTKGGSARRLSLKERAILYCHAANSLGGMDQIRTAHG